MGLTAASLKINLGVMVITACLGVFLALTFSSVFLLNRSGEIADKVRHEQETRLVEHELNHQIIQFARDQSQISDWDASYTAFWGQIDDKFVLENLTNWLWNDFGIFMTYVVSPRNKNKIAIVENRRLDAGQGQHIIDENLDLVEEARAKYLEDFTEKRHLPAVKLTRDILAEPQQGRFAWSIRTINGQLAYVMAQAIGPEYAVQRGDKNPDILFTVKQIDKSTLIAAGEKLMVENFHFDFLYQRHEGHGHLPIVALPDGRIVHVRWTPDNPSETIWNQTLPILALPYALAALALIVIAWRFSHMLHALQYSEEQNRFLALHDAVTGLPNRLYFDHALEETISSNKYEHCVIISLDLDRFKAVNDRLGHEAGDVVLSTVSERISESLGKLGIAARVGGDEFSILFYDRLELEDLQLFCERLIEVISQPILVPGGVADVGASIGVARWPEDATTVKSVLRCADDALYFSKENGRGQVSIASRKPKPANRNVDQRLGQSIDKLREILGKTA